MEDINEDEWSADRIKMIDEFLTKYRPYQYQKIDEERFFNNLGQFVKYGAGNISMKEKNNKSTLGKYQLENRRQYLDILEGREEGLLKGGLLGELMEEFGVRERRENKKEYVWF